MTVFRGPPDPPARALRALNPHIPVAHIGAQRSGSTEVRRIQNQAPEPWRAQMPDRENTVEAIFDL